MTSEIAQPDAQPTEVRREDSKDPLQVFATVFRRQLDQAIEPIVANIRRQQPFAAHTSGEQASASEAVRQGDNQGESGAEVSPAKDSVQPVRSVTLNQPLLEGVLQAALDVVLDVHFSDGLQAVFRERSEHAVQSLLTAARKLASEGQPFALKPKQFAETIDELVADSFSESSRENARRHGEKAIRELISWDAPAARRAGAKLLSELTEQRFTASEKFWRHVLVTLLEAGSTAAEPNNGQAKNNAEEPEPVPEQDIPQTLVRSDKRAQEIWVKARDKAADKDGSGAGAERAAYAALKQHYEKRGDHWVKKTSEHSNGEKESGSGELANPSRRALTKPKQ